MGKFFAFLVCALALVSCGESRSQSPPRHYDFARPADGVYRSDAQMRTLAARFFSAYLKRPLSAEELRQVTHEWLVHCDRFSAEERREYDAGVAELTEAIRRHDPLDGAHAQRRALLVSNYFSPSQQRTLTLALLGEPDPVRVASRGSEQVMTEGDVVAFVNVMVWLDAGGAPRHQRLTREQIEKAVSALKGMHEHPTRPMPMPRFNSEYAAYWAGVQREWPRLDATQREYVRRYPQHLSHTDLPVELFERVWGLDHTDAGLRRLSDTMDATMDLTLMASSIQQYVLMTRSIMDTMHNARMGDAAQ